MRTGQVMLVEVDGNYRGLYKCGWYVGYSKIKLRLAGKKYRIENKTLVYGTVTYLTELLFHIVAIHI